MYSDFLSYEQIFQKFLTSEIGGNRETLLLSGILSLMGYNQFERDVGETNA